MMSLIVTTSSADPIITDANSQNSASPQSWPSATIISAAMPVTMPRTASARTIGIRRRSTLAPYS